MCSSVELACDRVLPTPKETGGQKEAAAGTAQQSLVVIGVLRIKDFNMCEGEKPLAPIHLTFPLAVDIHPCDFHNVTNLQCQGSLVISTRYSLLDRFCKDRPILCGRQRAERWPRTERCPRTGDCGWRSCGLRLSIGVSRLWDAVTVRSPISMLPEWRGPYKLFNIRDRNHPDPAVLVAGTPPLLFRLFYDH